MTRRAGVRTGSAKMNKRWTGLTARISSPRAWPGTTGSGTAVASADAYGGMVGV